MWRRPARVGSLVLVLPLWAAVAAAQTPSDRPRYELGGQVSMLAGDDPSVAAAGPHLTINFGSRSALNLAGEWQVGPSDRNQQVALFRGQLEYAVMQSRQGNIFVTAGIGLWHASGHQPPFAFSDTTGLLAVGGGFTRALTQRLTLRADGELLFVSSRPTVRFSAGLAVPMGRFQTPTPANRTVGATPPLGSPESKVRPGTRVVVTTTDGRRRHGEIRAVSSSGILEVDFAGTAAHVPFAEVRRIEARRASPIVKGAVIGALAGGIPIGLYVNLLCANEGCSDGGAATATLGFAALGAGAGAFIGAVFDRGPHVLYDSSQPHALAVGPVVSGRGLGVGGTIRW